jgi:hypothetical protein
LLIKAGAAVDLADYVSALPCCVRVFGVNGDGRTSRQDDETPLMYCNVRPQDATEKRDIVRMLLHAGADPARCNKVRCAPLAACLGRSPAPRRAPQRGRNCFDLAAQCGWTLPAPAKPAVEAAPRAPAGGEKKRRKSTASSAAAVATAAAIVPATAIVTVAAPTAMVVNAAP